MYGRTNAGGGVSAKGFIPTTYPEGSICTCSDGSRTLKAKDTSGFMMFLVPYIGTWTVTATDLADPTNTASETVEITTEGQSVSVELSYRLTADYQEVEYIEGNGSSYINTGLYFTGDTSKLEVAFNYFGKSVVYGDNSDFNLYKGTNSTYLSWFNDQGYSPSLTSGRNVFTVDKNKVYRNGTLDKTFTASSSKTPKTITLFRKNGSTNDIGKIQIAEFRLYENDKLVMELIPCYRLSDSVAGFWDRIGKKFLTNAGSGTFVVGADV